jgi:hypothetical protein
MKNQTSTADVLDCPQNPVGPHGDSDEILFDPLEQMLLQYEVGAIIKGLTFEEIGTAGLPGQVAAKGNHDRNIPKPLPRTNTPNARPYAIGDFGADNAFFCNHRHFYFVMLFACPRH